MSSVISRATILAAILGFALGAIVALNTMNTADEEGVIDEALTDVTGEAYTWRGDLH